MSVDCRALVTSGQMARDIIMTAEKVFAWRAKAGDDQVGIQHI